MERWQVAQLDHAPVTLGLGLIGIGKPWGSTNPIVPDEADSQLLLERALSLNVRFFDTAPSYGPSEIRLGHFLALLSPTERRSVTIATKFGEHWNAEKQAPFVDHSFDALKRSLDHSLERLGQIDILQLHKTTLPALKSPGVSKALEYARSLGIQNVGASVSDLDSAEHCLSNPMISIIQVPFNTQSVQFRNIIERAASGLTLVLINRPFGMGSLLFGEQPITQSDAFRFILKLKFRGVVLSGTKSPAHLEQNVQAFAAALSYERESAG